MLGAADDQSGTVRDYIGQDHLRIAIEPTRTRGADIGSAKAGSRGEEAVEDFRGAFVDCEIGEFDTGEFIIAEAKRAAVFLSPHEPGARAARGSRSISRPKARSSASAKSWRKRRSIVRRNRSRSRARSRAGSVFRRPISSSSRRRNFSGARRPTAAAVCSATAKFGAQPRPDRFQRAERRRSRRPSRARHRPFLRPAKARRPGERAKCSRSSLPTRRSSTSRSSRPIWFRAMSGSGKNRRRSVP